MQIPLILTLEVSIMKSEIFWLIEISYSWIKEYFSDPPYYLETESTKTCCIFYICLYVLHLRLFMSYLYDLFLHHHFHLHYN